MPGAAPKKRHTRSQRNRRRMHIFLKTSALVKCSKCGALTMPHTVCERCGYYKEREVIDVLKELTKKEKKAREKEMAAQEKEQKKEGPLSMEGLSKK